MKKYDDQFKQWNFNRVAQNSWNCGTFKQLKQASLEADFFIQFMLWGY